ncbi:MAG: CRTAC1 family protein [Planctomycetes bacterium]|nr:CRTAC1 family protein [Planctomycetota bacterium]
MPSRRPWILLPLLTSACERPAPEPARGWFTDVAREAGLDFVHSNGAAGACQVPEIMGSGCAWIDHDQDGDLDAYLVSAGFEPARARNRLFRNDRGRFADVTDSSGTGDPGFGMGCAVGDYDADGFPDLYVTNFGPNALLRNRGDGTFADDTARAGAGDPRWSASAAFVDADSDGDLDLFVANYMRHPRVAAERREDAAGRLEYCGPLSHFGPERNTLYVNRGDGTFRDGTEEAGMAGVLAYGLGVACGDFTGDGKVDIYVAADETPNQLWAGDGRGRFADRAVELGAAFNLHGQAQAGMGVQAEDVDGDGAGELFVTNLSNETNAFYRALGGGCFEDIVPRTGLAAPSLPVTGFGCGFLDADSDGDLDLLVANGRIRRGPRVLGEGPAPPWDLYAERDQLFEHIAAEPPEPGRGTAGAGARPEGPWGFRFADRSAEAGPAFRVAHLGRGLALGDYDSDGDVDALVTACGGPARLLRNDAPRRGRWLIVRALGGAGRGDATGASITVSGGGRKWTRGVDPAYGYLSSSDPRPHFGLGEVEVVDVEVRWPDGTTTAVRDASVDRVVTVEKGVGERRGRAP